MARCLISLGANLGHARASVLAAVDLLRERLDTQLELSRLYHTPPVGGPSGQDAFVNAVVAVHTNRSPWDVWHVICSIEQQLGRQRIERWEARRIDLDILLYEDVRIWTGQLKIPHPRMSMRRFILQPAADVASDWIDPVSQWTIEQLANSILQGPGNLVLVARPESSPQSVLQTVAQTTSARVIEPHCFLDQLSLSDNQRVVGWSDFETWFSRLQVREQLIGTTGKLAFVWLPTSNQAAWEDECRELAVQLGLAEAQPNSATAPLQLQGPRYLLASNDAGWVAHELIAALEAMDCTIQPLDENSGH